MILFIIVLICMYNVYIEYEFMYNVYREYDYDRLLIKWIV